MRTKGKISILNPMNDKHKVDANGKSTILRPGHYIWDAKEERFVSYHEYFSRPENNAPAVHTDEGWVSKFDWGAGKNWKDHGGRRGREDWMKRDGIQCKG